VICVKHGCREASAILARQTVGSRAQNLDFSLKPHEVSDFPFIKFARPCSPLRAILLGLMDGLEQANAPREEQSLAVMTATGKVTALRTAVTIQAPAENQALK
jgi:hypothetical protein